MKCVPCLPPATLRDLLLTEVELRYRRDYWVVDRYYAFEAEVVESVLVPAVEDLWAMCCDFIGVAIEKEHILSSLGIPPSAWDAVRQSWRQNSSAFWARFDLSFDGAGPPKLHECNIDVPGHVHEAEFYQKRWFAAQTAAVGTGWHGEQFAGLGRAIAAEIRSKSAGLPITFLCIGDDPYDALNDYALQEILRGEGMSWDVEHFLNAEDFAQRASVTGATQRFGIKNFRWDPFIFEDSTGPRLDVISARVAPPLWTLVLSSKGCLPWLWAFHPGHPNLLATYFDPRQLSEAQGMVSKPLLSLRGRNISLLDRQAGVSAVIPADPEDNQRYIYQELHYLPRAEGIAGRPWASTGVFVVGGKAVAMTMTESEAPVITDDGDRTVPHVLV